MSLNNSDKIKSHIFLQLQIFKKKSFSALPYLNGSSLFTVLV